MSKTLESVHDPLAGGATGAVEVRAATLADVPAIAGIFGRAFDDYRRGFGVGPETLGRLWEGSLAARVESTLVATIGEDVVGFVVFVLPGAKEQYGGRGTERRRFQIIRTEVGLSTFWRMPLLFIPMGLAYMRRNVKPDELYVSLIGVDPAHQGKRIGRALLAAVEQKARGVGASAVLLHTASSNRQARGAYERTGYELICTVRAPWRGPANIPAYIAYRKAIKNK